MKTRLRTGRALWIDDRLTRRPRQEESPVPSQTEAFDRVVLTTHGANCGCGCLLQVGARDGRVFLETPIGWPGSAPNTFSYGPRACAAGLTASWYLDHPSRIRSPHVRSVLVKLWREARRRAPDPVDAWSRLVSDPGRRRQWQRARGRGGFERVSWDEALEMTAAAVVSTIIRSGSDHVAGYAAGPASELAGYASGARLLQLLGGVLLSSADWEGNLCAAAARAWGDCGDMSEAADWLNARLIVALGEDIPSTPCGDTHLLQEARRAGGRLWAISTRAGRISRNADRRLKMDERQAAAFWLAVNHFVLRKGYVSNQNGRFEDYLLRFTEAPFLVGLVEEKDSFSAGDLVTASRWRECRADEDSREKFLVWDRARNLPAIPRGSRGFLKENCRGKWNLKMRDALDDCELRPALSLTEQEPEWVGLSFVSPFSGQRVLGRVPSRLVEHSSPGPLRVTTSFDLLLATFQASEGATESPLDWAARICRLTTQDISALALEFMETAASTSGRCLVLSGWEYNQTRFGQLAQAAAIQALILCGCPGAGGGGFGFFPSQDKVHVSDSWRSIAFAEDWVAAQRLEPSCRWFAAQTHDSEKGKVMLAWKGNPISANAPGHEHLLKNLLGANANCERTGGTADPPGRLDLLVSANFRMDTTALYSDVLLPAAFWYEKNDINSALISNSIQPLALLVPPAFESRSEWQIFASLAERVSALSAGHFDRPFADVFTTEESQSDQRPGAGNSSQGYVEISRDYRKVAEQYTSLGPRILAEGLLVDNGVRVDISESLAEAKFRGILRLDPADRIDLSDDEQLCNFLLHCSSATNPSLAESARMAMEELSGLELSALKPDARGGVTSHRELCNGPVRPLNRPIRKGAGNDVAGYAAFSLQVNDLVPWPTRTGRQRLTWDPNGPGDPIDWDQALLPLADQDLRNRKLLCRQTLSSRGIDSLFSDMPLTGLLGRGLEPLQLSVEDARILGVEDNDWVEISNRNGAVVSRVALSDQVPAGTCCMARSDRILGVPRSPTRDLNRAGWVGSLSEVPLPPRWKGPISSLQFNLAGPTAVPPDVWVEIRRIDKVEI